MSNNQESLTYVGSRKEIVLGDLEDLVKDLFKSVKASNFVLISDENLEKAGHVSRIKQVALLALQEQDHHSTQMFLTYIIPPGEQSKCRKRKQEIEDFMLSQHCTRDTCLLALGGGVIGDLVGYVAATFMRGIPFFQIPTSMLSMVDSSIGGKTGIDTPAGKNLIGAFWQPVKTCLYLDFLKTLPSREFINGLAEVIKTAAIWDEECFQMLENNVEEILAQNQPELLRKVVLSSARVKSHIVSQDEREAGLRGLLNFGHSIGHAIEAILTPHLLHGECVAIGMVLECELSRLLGHLNSQALGRLTRLLQAYGLPTSLSDKRLKQLVPKTLLDQCSADKLLEIMRIDKKNVGSSKRIVLLQAIGKTLELKASPVADKDIHLILSPALNILPYGAKLSEPIVVNVPGSKSISNRALLLAALSSGECRINGLLHSDDTQVMLTALQQLSACKYHYEEETLVVQGGGGNLTASDKPIYLGNAGTAARFLTTVATLASSSHPVILTGNARMKQRPIGPLVDSLRSSGQVIRYMESEGCLPLEIQGGKFMGGRIRLAASVSSQYVSSILLCAPYARNEVQLELTGGKVISQPYIDMTIAMMESFGAKVERLPNDIYRIKRGIYQSPGDYVVEVDASSATYPLAVAAMTGQTVFIPNLGKKSLQGDARFAVDVLKPMGCYVVQTALHTTVTGPPNANLLKALELVDMEPMTDAFLTATVLAAVATGGSQRVTRIRGIANQRVKECDRIKAMRVELGKLGVKCEEHPDGIDIHAVKIDQLTAPKASVGIECYDDHRVAMSMSVIAGLVSGNGVVITDKKCVEKTWPSWWDAYSHTLTGKLEGAHLAVTRRLNTQFGIGQAPPKRASWVLIGMRGAGKTTVGKSLARMLDYEMVDLDAVFVEKHGEIKSFVDKNGWEAFRAAEFEILQQVLLTKRKQHIISCGGGVVETLECRNLLKAFSGPVLHVRRDFNEIVTFLEGKRDGGNDVQRPNWGEATSEVWKRREPWYEECSQWEFFNLQSLSQSQDENELQRLADFITKGFTPPKLENTFFLSLTFSSFDQVEKDHLLRIAEGADYVELRVDLLKDPSSPASPSVPFVVKQLSLVRKILPRTPIIYTVRTVEQGGAFPNNVDLELARLLQAGIRWGCEIIDLETSWEYAQEISTRRGCSLILASWHDPLGKVAWDSMEMQLKYQQASSLGQIVKLVSFAQSVEDNILLRNFVKDSLKFSEKMLRPLIALNMGEYGKLSRVLNRVLTPVTHSLLNVAAAPGQLSIKEIMIARHLIGMLPKKQFYLFGSPISKSLSPQLHNAGFDILGLPHRYSLWEVEEVSKVIEAIHRADFGGASVTIPHKESIIPCLDLLTESAKEIGAVNTIICKGRRKRQEGEGDEKKNILIGDNTDWLGIYHNVRRQPSSFCIKSALILGAGGTSKAAIYAAHKLGAERIYVWNRSDERLKELINSFSLLPLLPLSTLECLPNNEEMSVDLIISTVAPEANLESLSDEWFSKKRGIFVELVYNPRVTGLMERAQGFDWNIVTGLGVLLEQGLEQFERWTGKPAPRLIMQEAIFRN